MKIQVGNNELKNIFIGSKKISKIYKGSSLIFNSDPIIVPPQPDIGVTTDYYHNIDDNQRRKVIWTVGVKPPKLGTNLTKPTGSDFSRIEYPASGDVTYDCQYQHGNWYDTKKSDALPLDDNLCFYCDAVNSLQWWFDRNEDNINKFISYKRSRNEDVTVINKLEELKNGSRGQLDGAVFKHYYPKLGKRNRGYWPDAVQDCFLNGYPFGIDKGEGYAMMENREDVEGIELRDNGVEYNKNPHPLFRPLSGFFYDVFKEKRLTKRHYISTNFIDQKRLNEIIRDNILKGNALGMTFYMGKSSDTHAVTIWGAELDENDNVCALFYCDNNDQPIYQSIKRFKVVFRDSIVYLTTKKDGSDGTKIAAINVLNPGKQYWEEYFKDKK